MELSRSFSFRNQGCPNIPGNGKQSDRKLKNKVKHRQHHRGAGTGASVPNVHATPIEPTTIVNPPLDAVVTGEERAKSKDRK
jgi:hypothetical protein